MQQCAATAAEHCCRQRYGWGTRSRAPNPFQLCSWYGWSVYGSQYSALMPAGLMLVCCGEGEGAASPLPPVDKKGGQLLMNGWHVNCC